MKMDHKELNAWKRAIQLVMQVYKETDRYPKSELHGLTNQMRRCAVSIPSNIAEGAARYTDKETTRYLYISLGSLSELETQLMISSQLGYISSVNVLLEEIVMLRKMIVGLIKYLKRKEGGE